MLPFPARRNFAIEHLLQRDHVHDTGVRRHPAREQRGGSPRDGRVVPWYTPDGAAGVRARTADELVNKYSNKTRVHTFIINHSNAVHMAEDPRYKAMFPLTGGYKSFISTLEKILEMADRTDLTPDDFYHRLSEELGATVGTIKTQIDFLRRVDILIEDSEGFLRPNHSILRGGDVIRVHRAKLVDQFDEHVVGLYDILYELYAARLIVEDLKEILTGRYNVEWDEVEQVRRRIHWLRTIGYVEMVEGGRHYKLTDEGIHYVKDRCSELLLHPRTIFENQHEIEFSALGTPDRFPEPKESGQLTSQEPLDENLEKIDKKRASERIFLLVNRGNAYGYGALISSRPSTRNQSYITYRYLDSEVDSELTGINPNRTVIDVPQNTAMDALERGSITFSNTIMNHDDYSSAQDFPGDGRRPSSTGQTEQSRNSQSTRDTSSRGEVTITEHGDQPGQTKTQTYAEWSWNINPFSDVGGVDDIPLDPLHFPNQGDLVNQILTALKAGDHIILVGPPGTGKSELARKICEYLVGDQFKMVTATADWSTFNTIGGYRPTVDDRLRFHPGVFLQRFQTEDGEPKNEWLVIDEINRADIDKAFGSLFSAIVGDSVQTPFREEDHPVEILGSNNESRSIHSSRYYVPENWRMIATMNTYDKNSLYEMSYAFMRRFAFIHVDPPARDHIDSDLIEKYAENWDVTVNSLAEPVADIWRTIQSERALGPAIIERVLRYVEHAESEDLNQPICMYVIPQLEGLTSTTQIEIVRELIDIESVDVDSEELVRFSSDYLGISKERFSVDE